MKKRKADHYKSVRYGSNFKFHQALRKHKNNDFKWEILEECKQNELDEKETKYIDEFNSYKNGYNMTFGGGSYYHNEETKEKLRNIRLGVRHSKEARKNMKKANSGKNNGMYGKKHSEETKEKIKKSAKKQKNRANKKWYFLNPNNKPIIINDLKEFCRKNSLSFVGMKMCKYGKQKQHKGWKSINEI